jgi:hypothetical protein
MPNLNGKIPSAKTPRGILPTRQAPTPESLWGEEDRERIPPATRAKVWKKRFGFRSTGTCVCCHQKTIYRDDFACGRRLPIASGGSNDVSNLEPICSSCYRKVGTHDLVSWCKKVHQELKAVKPMPKTATPRKTVRKTTAKKPAAAKKAVRKPAAKKPAAAKKTIRKTTAKKPAAKKAKR